MGLCGMYTLSSYLVLNKHSLSRVNRFCLWPNYYFVRGLAPLAMPCTDLLPTRTHQARLLHDSIKYPPKVRTFSWTFFTIHELQKSCVSIPEKLSDVVSSYQARTSEFPQEEFLRRGAAFLVSREEPTSGRTVDVDPVSFSEFHWA